MFDMRKVTVTIDGEEYIAVPKYEYYRLLGKAPPDAVDAIAFTLVELGKSLRAAREHAGISQAELAKKMKKSQATVSGSEAGKIRVSEDYVRKVLKVCGLPETWKAPG